MTSISTVKHFVAFTQENGMDVDETCVHLTFDELGYDSVLLLTLLVSFETQLGVEVSFDNLDFQANMPVSTFLQKIDGSRRNGQSN
jgi:acyl carrier protein